MSEQEKIQELQFLLDLAISKLIDMTGIKDYPDFILRYRLTESKSLALMDEIVAIEEEVKQGKTITSIEILNRLGKFDIRFGTPPTTFVREVLEILSPEILFKMLGQINGEPLPIQNESEAGRGLQPRPERLKTAPIYKT